jgi:hypothetical protein
MVNDRRVCAHLTRPQTGDSLALTCGNVLPDLRARLVRIDVERFLRPMRQYENTPKPHNKPSTTYQTG